MEIEWTEGSEIRVRTDGSEVMISANREALLSLAAQFRVLAEGKPGDHIHYDEYNSLEDGSSAMIVEKTE